MVSSLAWNVRCTGSILTVDVRFPIQHPQYTDCRDRDPYKVWVVSFLNLPCVYI